MDFSTLYRVMVVKVVTVIRSEVSIHLVNDSPVNAIANLALLGMTDQTHLTLHSKCENEISFPDSIAINVNRISTASHRLAANHATVTAAVRRDTNAIRMVNVPAMTTLKVDDVIDAKRTNTIDIKGVWIVHIATIWYKKRQTNIVKS